jgi:hypothetical protein
MILLYAPIHHPRSLLVKAQHGQPDESSTPYEVRTWLVLSIAWTAYCAWKSDIACPLELIGMHTGAPKPWCDYQNAEPLDYCGNLLLEMIRIPALVLPLMAADWMWRGFRA